MKTFLILAVVFVATFALAANAIALVIGYVWPVKRSEV